MFVVQRRKRAAGAFDDDAIGDERELAIGEIDPANSIFTPAWAAARCGAIAGAKAYGLRTARGTWTLPAASSAATSSLRLEPRAIPLATGFMPTARKPRAACARSSAHAATVLPTPVSVPVTNMPLLIGPPRSRPSPRYDGSPALARAAIEAHDRTPIVDDARLGLPRMSVNDLKACR